MDNFENKFVYITGGSSGIGLAIAQELATKGAHLLLLARRPAMLEEARLIVEKKRRSNTQKIVAMSLDVQNDSDVQQTMQQAVKTFGVPDILITCAGIISADYFTNISYATFDSVIKTNLYGIRNVVAALLPHMQIRGGQIVMISSLGGLIGSFGYTAYSSSKFAVVGFAECLRAEARRHGVKVSIVCPPEVDTPMILEESKTIPPETRALKNLVGTLSPAYVARYIVRGIQRKRYLIIPGFLAKYFYYINCYLPFSFIHMTADITAAIASRRIKTKI